MLAPVLIGPGIYLIPALEFFLSHIPELLTHNTLVVILNPILLGMVLIIHPVFC